MTPEGQPDPAGAHLESLMQLVQIAPVHSQLCPLREITTPLTYDPQLDCTYAG
jgi:hypothetical protein